MPDIFFFDTISTLSKRMEQNMFKKTSKENLRIAIMLLTILVCMLTFAAIQPFGDGPDEINRFKLVEYIYQHGKLPVGDDPEVLIDGYGGSYAFQPMLTYIIDGFLLRCLKALEPALEMRVFISRLVNVLIGLFCAIYTKKLSDLLFENKKTAWAFTLAVVFLPQNLFMHTYVNTDSMGLLSIAIVLYALLKGMQDDFSKNTCMTLAAGIILCALSYYNCYGIIVCAVLFFVCYFWNVFRTKAPSSKESNKVQVFSYDLRALLQKGIFISIIVLVCIGWWFIRNAILYNGDFLALEARNICAAQTGLESYNPYTRDTYQRLGIPLMEMIFGTDYFTLVWKSFIAMFGPMMIPTHHYIYMAFKYLFFMAAAGLLIPMKTSLLTWAKAPQKWLVHGIMLLGIIIPVTLALYYSYTFDFQPQGRYYLPMVIPFIYFLAAGVEKLITLISYAAAKITIMLLRLRGSHFNKTSSNQILSAAHPSAKWTGAFLYHLLYAFWAACLLYATFISMMGYYNSQNISLF